MVTLLQQRMDKCTTEQFWAVTTLTGLNLFIISEKRNIVRVLQKTSIIGVLPNWFILSIVTVATFYGAYFIIQRHISYYQYRADLAKLLQGEKDVPDFLKKCPDKWKGHSLSGVLFHTGWIIALWLMDLFAYIVV